MMKPVTLTKVQERHLLRLLSRIDGVPDAEFLVATYNGEKGDLVLGSTTNAAPLYYAAGLIFLRRALEVLPEQTEWPLHAAMMEALQTALPYLGVPPVTEAVVQGKDLRQ